MVPALLGGVAGSAAMTVATQVQRRLRRDDAEPVDYDASEHVTTAVAAVLRREPRTALERRVYFALAHWGYGSAVALAYPPLQRALPQPGHAPAALWAGCQAMALVLLPTLGGTPPPWRWRRDLVATSVGHHVVYVAVVAATTRALRRASS